MTKKKKAPERKETMAQVAAAVAHDNKDLSTPEIVRQQQLLFREAELLGEEIRECDSRRAAAEAHLRDVSAALEGLRLVLEAR